MRSNIKTPQALSQALSTLTKKPEAFPWQTRRDFVRSSGDALREGRDSKAAISLLLLLAGDPRWEVRQAVAQALPVLANGDFAKVALTLLDDANDFVRIATERAVDQRQRTTREESRQKRGIERIEADFGRLEKMHGQPAAKKARRIAERMHETYVGMAVHNFRGLVTPIHGNVVTMLDQVQELDNAGFFQDRLVRIKNHANLLMRLVDDMQTMAQEPSPERRRCRISDIVTEAHDLATSNLRQSPAAIGLQVSVPRGLTALVSQRDIMLAVANVIQNAFEAFLDEASGQVSVRAQAISKERFEIVVRDNGIGIPTEDLPEIFVPGRTSKLGWGTGHGLAIALKNVRAHGGSIGVESRENEGTTVTITLPVDGREEEE